MRHLPLILIFCVSTACYGNSAQPAPEIIPYASQAAFNQARSILQARRLDYIERVLHINRSTYAPVIAHFTGRVQIVEVDSGRIICEARVEANEETVFAAEYVSRQVQLGTPKSEWPGGCGRPIDNVAVSFFWVNLSDYGKPVGPGELGSSFDVSTSYVYDSDEYPTWYQVPVNDWGEDGTYVFWVSAVVKRGVEVETVKAGIPTGKAEGVDYLYMMRLVPDEETEAESSAGGPPATVTPH
ncbi:MAG: hypothetical protein Q7Q73_10660 [Verrucomicrobiota bacterium JB024]|nr:hypothetical protein [Verrucomicrobiota bacterium JB024]